MIMQFADVINKDNPHPVQNITGFSNNRFFNDRILRIPAGLSQPRLGGQIGPLPETYVLYLKINAATPFATLRLRTQNGSIISYTRGKVPGMFVEGLPTELSVDTLVYAGRTVCVCFAVGGVGQWRLDFGTEAGWDSCPLVADCIGLIRTSRPTDNLTLELPRHVAGVRSSWNVLGGDLRGSVGQPYGRAINRLRTYTAEYRHVHADVIDEYFERVSTTIPHWIVPYLEEVANVPPIWGTLAAPPDMRKRAVNDWHWDLRLSWQEAY